MPRFSLLLLATTLLILQQSCNTRQQDTDKSADSTTAAGASGSAANPAADPLITRLTALGLTGNSHWRGISLGDSFAEVKSVEKGEAFESDAQHVGYTVEFENLESMDVLYYQQQGKVSAIDVDLFLNNRASVDAYVNDLTAYLSSRYGSPKAGKPAIVWRGPAGEQVSLTDVSKGKDFGLKLKIAPATGSATASLR